VTLLRREVAVLNQHIEMLEGQVGPLLVMAGMMLPESQSLYPGITW